MLEKVDTYPRTYLGINNLMRGALNRKVGMEPVRDVQWHVVDEVKEGMVSLISLNMGIRRGISQCPRVDLDFSVFVRHSIFNNIAAQIHQNRSSVEWERMMDVFNIQHAINEALGVEVPW